MIALALAAAVFSEWQTPTPSEWRTATFSVYATRYHGRIAANGKPYNHNALTCASNRHKLGTKLELEWGGNRVTVTVTDRMDKRLGKSRIDLSGAAYKTLDPRMYDMTDATAGLLARGRFREVAK